MQAVFKIISVHRAVKKGAILQGLFQKRIKEVRVDLELRNRVGKAPRHQQTSMKLGE